MTREQEAQRLHSMICRMAGNIASGMVGDMTFDVDGEAVSARVHAVAQASVDVALAIAVKAKENVETLYGDIHFRPFERESYEESHGLAQADG